MGVFHAPSPLHGNGLFTDSEIKPGEFIGMAFRRKPYMVSGSFANNYTETEYGRYVNHYKNPNIELRIEKTGIGMYASRHIQPGDELLSDYNDLINLFDGEDSLLQLVKFW